MSFQTLNLQNVEEDDASNRPEGGHSECVGARPRQLWEQELVLSREEGAATLGNRERDDEEM